MTAPVRHGLRRQAPRLLATLVLALCTLSPNLLAQEQTRGAQGRMQLYLTVLDDDDRPVADLFPEEVIIEENGIRCEIIELGRPRNYADVTILVDTSETLVPATSAIRESLGEFVTVLDGFARMSLTTFGDIPVQLVRPTTQARWLHDGVEQVFPQLGTNPNFQDALVQAAVDLRDRRPERPSVVVITSDQMGEVFADSSPSTVGRNLDAFIETLQYVGAPVHTLVVRSRDSFEIMQRGIEPTIRPDVSLRNSMIRSRTQEWLTTLSTVSQHTGGRLVNVFSASRLRHPLLQVANEIMAQYVLTYARPDYGLVEPEQINININITRDDLKVRATPVG